MANSGDEQRRTKQVIVMRRDLGMGKGKMVAQGCHASLAALLVSGQLVGCDTPGGGSVLTPVRLWLSGQVGKVCVSVGSEAELHAIYARTSEIPGLPAALIVDAGLTQFRGVPTKTCCALGPWWADELDQITGSLPLL